MSLILKRSHKTYCYACFSICAVYNTMKACLCYTCHLNLNAIRIQKIYRKYHSHKRHTKSVIALYISLIRYNNDQNTRVLCYLLNMCDTVPNLTKAL